VKSHRQPQKKNGNRSAAYRWWERGLSRRGGPWSRGTPPPPSAGCTLGPFGAADCRIRALPEEICCRFCSAYFWVVSSSSGGGLKEETGETEREADARRGNATLSSGLERLERVRVGGPYGPYLVDFTWLNRPVWFGPAFGSFEFGRNFGRKKSFWVVHRLPKSNFRPSSAKPDIWDSKSGYFLSLSCFGGWFSHDFAAIEYIRSPSYQKYLFLVSQLSTLFIFPWLFGRWYSHDVALGQHTRHMRRWDPMMSHDYLLPFSHSSFPLPNTSFSLSHPYPERRSSRIVVQRDELVRWRETSELRRAPVMEHAERYDTSTTGSCGRARGERKKEATWHVGPTITRTSHVWLIITLCENHPLKQSRDLK
jgi:hypothetical protein